MEKSPTNRISPGLLILTLFSALLLSSCTHTITLRSDPPGALIQDLEKGGMGRTPTTVSVSKGDSLHLTFSKEGFAPVKRDVLQIQQDQTLMVTMKTYATLLYIESNPPGASLTVYNATDGTEVQLENPTKINTEFFYTNRRHEIPSTLTEADIVLKKRGYKTMEKRVRIEPNIENRFQFQMEQLSAKLKISSIPSGAEVYDRNIGFLGRTPLVRDFSWEQLAGFSRLKDAFDLDSVDLHLSIRKQGYANTEILHKLNIYTNNPELIIELHPAK